MTIKYAVYYLKNSFNPLNVPEHVKLEHGQMILARTEKGEEALKVVLVNQEISKIWEKAENKPQAFDFIRVMSQHDLEILENIKKEEVTSFFKCKELVEKHKLNMN